MIMTMDEEESLFWSLVDTLLAFGVLLGATIWLQLFLNLGILSGRRLAEQASSSTTRLDGTRRPPDYQLLGLVCFGVWTSVMGTLLLVR